MQKILPFIVCGLLVVCGWLILQDPPHRSRDGKTPLNVVFILADDLGWADSTLYGATRLYRTPNLDRLAARGMTFTQAYSDSPLCSPTRAAMLTGLSPARTGITRPHCHLPTVALEPVLAPDAPPSLKVVQPASVTRLKTEYHTLAKSLKAAGYATGHFGKWHLGDEPYSPLEHGFDVDVPHDAGPAPNGGYLAPWEFAHLQADPNVPGQHIEDRLAAEAVAWMERHRDEPYFLNYWMYSVHVPFQAKPELIDKYRGRIDPNDAQRSPTYAAMVESMDDAVGTLLDALDRLQLAERTIVVFVSDNGGNTFHAVDGVKGTSNAPLRGGKATIWEGGIRVPCVVCWPGVTLGGSRSDALIQGCDFYPTLLDGLKLDPPPDQPLDGVSFLPALRGRSSPRDAVFTFYPYDPHVPDWLPPSVAVRRGDWKLIRVFHDGENGAHRRLLYNLRDDLGEKTDRSEFEPTRVAELDALIEQFLLDMKAVVPILNPAYRPPPAVPNAPN